MKDEMLGLAADPYAYPLFKSMSINMNVLYRTGETHQGTITYTPLLLSIDFQGSLGSVSSKGTLYSENSNASSEVVTWLWMDAQEFNYGSGRDVFMENLRGEEICDRLRFFTEECDHIQGFQFIVDDSGGFSPLAADFLESVSDEYMNTPESLYAVRGPNSHMNLSSRKQKVVRDLHDAVSFSRLSCFCKLIVPVGIPFLSRSKASTFPNIKDESPYRCSAVYAAALHSTSLPFRMEAPGPTADSSDVCGAVDVNGIVQMLAGQSRQNMLAILDVEMPGPSLTGRQNEQSLLANLQTLTPEDVDDWQAVESMNVHGAIGPVALAAVLIEIIYFFAGGRTASVSEVKNAIHGAYGCATSTLMFCHLSVAQCPLPIPLPFPSIFGNLVGQHGELLGSPILGSAPRGSLDVHSIPMTTRMRSSSAILPFLENRLGSLRKFGIERGCPGTELLRSWGFGKDEVEDIGKTLSNMVRIVNPHSEISSDLDSD
ncbi:Plasma membrane, myosin-like, Tubulin/FtsZ, N-terminal isoform 6 [Hibiscus syriacus]|uniref:Plasma membrane, myosin-like, Tubulin/FtsZ, N-terminal isoform 6 n=1 Tax=Hibiscus syriacus TaxID=106335 RepID=A0A6A2Z8V4_HIBSY|nr:Plasma membrane, myosin-like, Tubulin/FtsZ, N-terminal isoform 6 [Hibiscus syriacus]